MHIFFLKYLYIFLRLLFFEIFTMTKPIPMDTQNALKVLLGKKTPYSKIMKMLPNVSKTTISKYNKRFFGGAKPTHVGRKSQITSKTQQYIGDCIRNGKMDGPKAAVKFLASQGIPMTTDGLKKMLRRNGFKARRKVNTNLISTNNIKRRLAWAKAHRHYTVADWRKWVFSDETRVNIWGSDGTSYYWSDEPGSMRPHQIKTRVQNNGGGVMFWGCITAEGPGYGTTILEGTIKSEEYVEILETSLLDTLDYYDKNVSDIRFQQDNATPHKSVVAKKWFRDNGFSVSEILDWPAQSPDLNPIEHVWAKLKSCLDAYETHATTPEELANRISAEWYKITKDDCLKYIDSMPRRIEAVIKSKGGPTAY